MTTNLEQLDLPITTIEPRRGWRGLDLPELWANRELLLFFVWRDLKVRYKQTVLGAAWAVLQPLLTMVVFSVFFGRLAKVPSDGVPYPLFSYAALVPWTFFSNGLTQGAQRLVGSANLLKRVYFPRLVLPISSVVAGIVDMLIAFAVLLVLMPFYGAAPTMNAIFLPAFMVLAVVACLGGVFWLSAMNVEYRDVRYAVPFLVQIWMFATPVAYPSSLVPERWRVLFALNPMVGVVEGFRWALLGTDTAPGPMIAVSATTALALLISGAFYFRRMERRFADVV